MPPVVDLRSDTVTRPTPAMRRAMAEAEVGDDVLEDDPSIHRLQEMAAKIMGKEAALFVPTGTMGNAIAIKVHTQPGDEILLDGDSHSMVYEVGLPATIANVLTRQFRSRQGVPDVEDVATLFHEETLHTPRTSLLVLENTHNRAGGAIVPHEVHRQLEQLARQHAAKVHIDGARIFNAVVATGVQAAEYAGCADSITFCLSKGLGCPVGSVLCGSKEFIERAKRVRKMLGGGMRQAGVLAAAGIYALQNHIDRLAEDHRNAKRLAEGIADHHGLSLFNPNVPTNMVYVNTPARSDDFVQALEARGVLCLTTAPHRIRLVTHLDVDTPAIDRAIEAIRDVAAQTH